MFTSKGNSLMMRLQNGASGDELADLLRPAVNRIPGRVANRITSTGAGANGAFSTPYSKRWGRERTKANLPVSKKNFTFSGDMLGSIQIVEESSTPMGISFRLAPSGSNPDRSRSNYDIAQGHCSREGVNIIEMTQDEVDEFEREAIEIIKNYIRNVF